MSGYMLFAEDLRIQDVGRTVTSRVYRDKNKTTPPGRKETYKITSIYVHENGNILINNGKYLRAKTIVEFAEEQDNE